MVSYKTLLSLTIISCLLMLFSAIECNYADPSKKSRWAISGIIFLCLFSCCSIGLYQFTDCPNCSEYVNTDYCTNCGELVSIQETSPICPICNEVCTTNFCGKCGNKMIVEENSNE